MEDKKNITDFPVGVVGLGLMGCSIATCLLIAGHKVVAVAPISTDIQTAGKRITDHLSRSQQEGLINESP
ncbi:MAG: 3-hydroxyacyl-CoA dehydrogenase NAD-binding domain-containing protein, partial [Chitinophagaceae bacterium]